MNLAEAMWALRRFLDATEREIQNKYDFRCSQLLFVFGRLVREGRVSVAQLKGLSQDKLRKGQFAARLAQTSQTGPPQSGRSLPALTLHC